MLHRCSSCKQKLTTIGLWTASLPPVDPAARFEGNTSYHQDYPAHPVEPRHALASAQYQPNPAPFDGQTTHKGAFVAHPMEPRPHAGPNHQTRPSAPFEGSSSYKQDYGAHPMERRTPHQQAQYVPNPAPFDGTSSYNVSCLACLHEGGLQTFACSDIKKRPSNGPCHCPYTPIPSDQPQCYSATCRAWSKHPIVLTDTVDAACMQSAYTQHAMEPRTHGGPHAGSISHNSAPFEGQVRAMSTLTLR